MRNRSTTAPRAVPQRTIATPANDATSNAANSPTAPLPWQTPVPFAHLGTDLSQVRKPKTINPK